jgi:monofunctional biosynthetic peptidoglycan transglycosylase
VVEVRQSRHHQLHERCASTKLREKDPRAELKTAVGDLRAHLDPPQARRGRRRGRQVLEHEGFDWEGIQKALEKNQKKGKHRRRRLDHLPATGEEPVPLRLQDTLAQGAGSGHHPHAGTLWDKRRILEVYLNVVEWGGGVFGAEAAARLLRRFRRAALGRTGGAAGRAAARAAQVRPPAQFAPTSPPAAQLILGRMPHAADIPYF